MKLVGYRLRKDAQNDAEQNLPFSQKKKIVVQIYTIEAQYCCKILKTFKDYDKRYLIIFTG